MFVVDAGTHDAAVLVARDGTLLASTGELTPERAAEVADYVRAGGSMQSSDLELLDAEALLREVATARELARLHFEHDITADFVASAEGALLACNPVFLSMFAFESETDALTHNLADLYPSPAAAQLFLDALKVNGKLRDHQVELRAKTGRVVHAVQNVAVDDAGGRPVRIRGYIADRTAERQLEEQLQRWQRLEAVGRLAGGVAHDFNNLLTVILSYAQLLERHLPASSKGRDMVHEMHRAGERAADLTRRLLAFGRKQTLHSRPFDVNETVRRMVPLIRSVVGEAVELDLLLGDELGLVSGDAGQIEQVLMNLIVNARDAMSSGGKLTIETESVLVDLAYRRTHPWAKAGRYVLISVTDTGSGMPVDVQEHLFEPFFTTKGPGAGTGLGLASAYGIVQQHGGMLHVYSEEGVGTTLKVYLRITERPASAVGPKLRPRIVGGAETVVVAEDNSSVRGVLVRLLRERGYTVLEAENGERAVELCNSHGETSIVILDVVMPGIGGIAAYEQIRDLRRNLPIILTSGYSGERASDRFAQDPFAHFVPKPYSQDTMLEAVRRALDGQSDEAVS